MDHWYRFRWLRFLALGLVFGCAARLQTARELLDAGKASQALPMLREAAEERAEDPEVHTLLAEALRKTGDMDGAEAEYRTALNLNPTHLDARRGLLSLLLEQRRLVPAVPVAEALRKLAPEDPLVAGDAFPRLLVEAGTSALEHQHVLAAIRILEMARREAPGRKPEIVPALIRAYVVRARLLAEEGRHQDALAALERAEELGGGAREISRMKAKELVALGRHGQATAVLDALVAHGSRDDAYYAAQLMSDRPQDAVRYLEQAASSKDAGPDDLYALAKAYLGLKDVPRARRILARWLDMKGHTPRAYETAARLADSANAPDLVLTIRGEAAKRFPDDFRVVGAYADALTRTGRRDEALAVISSYDRAHSDASFEVAQWLENHGEDARAIQAYERAARRSPRRVIVYLRLARLHGKRLDIAARLRALDRYVRHSDDKVAAHRKVAGILADGGDLSGAIAHMEAAAKLAPRNPAILEDLARIYKGAGLPDKEEQVWRRYVDLRDRPADAALDVSARYRARGDLHRAAAFLELGLTKTKRREEEQRLLLGLFDLKRLMEDLQGVDEVLDRLEATARDARTRVALLEKARAAISKDKDRKLDLALVDRMLRLTPDAAELHFEKGRLLLLMGSKAEAKARFERYEALAKDKIAALGKIAKAYDEVYMTDDAARTLDRMVRLGADDPRIVLEVVNLRLEQAGEDDPRLVQMLDRLLAEAPGPEVDILGLAHRLQDHMMFTHALQAYRYADERKPLDRHDLLRMGQVLLALGRRDEADRVMERILAKVRGAQRGRVLLTWAQECVNHNLRAAAVDACERILTIGEGPVHQAFNLAVDLMGHDPERLVRLVELYRAKAQPPEEVYASIARAWERQGDLDRARDAWEQVLAHDPTSREALRRLAALLLDQGKASEAARLVERQLASSRATPEAWLEIARQYAKWGALPDAIGFYERALDAGGDPAVIQLERGKLLLYLGRREAGRTALEEALDKAQGSRFEKVALEAGQAYVAVGWDEEAIEVFERALGMQKTAPKYYAILVELYLRSGDLPEARKILAEARANKVPRLYPIGLSFEEAGYQDEAMAVYASVLESGDDPDLLTALWRMGVALVDRGDADRLQAIVQRVLASSTSKADVHWVAAKLYHRAGMVAQELMHVRAAAAGADGGGGGLPYYFSLEEAALRAGRRHLALEYMVEDRLSDISSGLGQDAAIIGVQFFLDHGEVDLAFELLDRLEMARLPEPDYHLLRARLLFSVGDRWSGLASLERAMATSQPADRDEMIVKAASLLEEEELHSEALEFLDRAGNPREKAAKEIRLQALAAIGDDQAVERAAKAYLEAEPKEGQTDELSVGAILRGRGRFAMAEKYLRQAMEVAADPSEESTALYHLLAVVLARGKDPLAEARAYVAARARTQEAMRAAFDALQRLQLWDAAATLWAEFPGLARDPDLARNALDLALATGEPSRAAVERIVDASMDDPDDTRSRMELLEAMASTLSWHLRVREAMGLLDEVLRMAPARFSPLEKMVSMALDTGDPELIRQTYERFLETAGPRPATWRWLLDRLVARGRGAMGLDISARLVEAAPGDLRNHYLRVACLLQARDEDAAKRATAEALAAGRRAPRVRVALSTLWLQGGFPLPDTSEEGRWAPRDLPEGWSKEAVSIAAPACGPGGHATACLVEGLARLRLGETPRAKELLHEAVRHGGGITPARLKPLPVLDRDARDAIGLLLPMKEKWADLAGYEAKLLVVADAYLAASLDDEALEVAERLVEVASALRDQAGVLMGRALLHGRARAAAAILDEISPMLRDRGWETTMLSEALYRAGETEQAERTYLVAMRQDPNEGLYYNNLAYLLANVGKDLERAEELVRTSMRLGPQGARYYADTMGWVLYKAGRYEEALRWTRVSLNLMDRGMGSTVSESMYHMGKIQQALGRGDQAARSFATCAAMDMWGEYGDKCRAELSEDRATPSR